MSTSPPPSPPLLPRLAAPLAAIRFLTRIPVPTTTTSSEQSSRDLRAAVPWFPLVGALIGAITAAVLYAATQVWSPPVAVLLALSVEALLTGAFHEDAVADYCDAFGGGWTRDDILRILKDSRHGTYGVLGLTLAVALRAALLLSLAASPQIQLLALIASATWGRFVIVLLMALVPPISDRDSLAKDVAQQMSLRDLVGASLAALPGLAPWLLLDPLGALLTLLLTAAFLLWYRPHLLRTIQGVTGDCLGMACYAGQLILLLGAAAR
jgi:adenosylcobinamide-GDP ribazoletransferase